MAETGARYRLGSSPRIAAYAGRRIRPSIEDKQWNVRFWPLPIGPGLPQPRSSTEFAARICACSDCPVFVMVTSRLIAEAAFSSEFANLSQTVRPTSRNHLSDQAEIKPRSSNDSGSSAFPCQVRS